MTAQPGLARRAVAELIGTLLLVAGGCGAIVADQQSRALGHLGVSLAFGLVILAAVTAGAVSGAHYNPVVSLAFTLTRHFPIRDAVVYVAAQLTGATLGALVLRAAWPDMPADLGATVPHVSVGAAVLLEAVATFTLVYVIYAVATDTRAVGAPAAIAIASAVALGALWTGPATGGSFNPARSFGPALVSGQWRDFWVYLVGPLAGGVLGALAYQFVRGERPATPTASASHHIEAEGADGDRVVRVPA
jgi:MIP family channel proteins